MRWMGEASAIKASFPFLAEEKVLLCNGAGKAAILFGKFVLVGKHAVATIDIAPGERLWCVLHEPFTHLWFMWVRRVKPGFWQAVGGGVDPGGAGYTVTFAKPLY